MDNQDIQQFFDHSDLADSVECMDRPPNMIWQFQGGPFPMFIQTQENANRMRIIAFVAEIKDLDRDELMRLMQANYHSALDARYAITDEYLVAAFIHPLRELTLTQFVMGLYQTMECADTCGTTYSGGTLVFGSSEDHQTGPPGRVESEVEEIMSEIVDRIRG